jgi:hypothetical protein
MTPNSHDEKIALNVETNASKTLMPRRWLRCFIGRSSE